VQSHPAGALRDAGLPQTFQILDSADQLAMVKRVMKSLSIDDEKYPPKQASTSSMAPRNKDYAPRRSKPSTIFRASW